jgi:hypothetical protein
VGPVNRRPPQRGFSIPAWRSIVVTAVIVGLVLVAGGMSAHDPASHLVIGGLAGAVVGGGMRALAALVGRRDGW